jgi:hypothetical protein
MAKSDGGLSESQANFQSDVLKLAPLLDLEEMPEQVADDLTAAILNYKDAKDHRIQLPEPRKADSDLSRLNQSAMALHELISNLGPAELERIAAVDPPGEKDLAGVVATLPAELMRIATACERAIREGRKKADGLSPDGEPLQKLVLSLMVIFERETGKEAGNSWDPRRNAYFGPFFDLTSSVLAIADPDRALSNSSLGSQITKALMKANVLSREYFARILARTNREKTGIEQASP